MSPNFVTLPLEVRNEIYSHVFDYDPITPYIGRNGKRLLFHRLRGHSDDFYAISDPKSFLALLEVNHKISNEAAAYFYGNMIFRGKWPQITAFIKGIGTRRRDMIRTVEIKHLALTDFQFDKDDTLELLGALPKLRTAHITTSVRDFRRLQNQLIQGGILEIAGKFDICVHNTYEGIIRSCAERTERRFRDEHFWSCAKNTTQWTGGNLNHTLFPESPGRWRS